ncbi:MAG: NDP-hexose 2,3-dehydratase family protein [Hyphomicrobiales bacterium]
MFARTLEDLKAIRERNRTGFTVSQVPMKAAEDWQLVDGALQHRSRGFFSVVGVSSDERGATGRLMLYQPQAATTGLLTTVVDGERFFLIQARAEPGCIGEVQYGPTVQSTPANYMRLHGGAAPPYVSAFMAYDKGVKLIGDTTQSDLGERYLMKSKRLILAECRDDIAVKPGFVWASAAIIRQALACSMFINIDLRSLLALMPWATDERDDGFSPGSILVRKSLRQPVRSEVIGRIFMTLMPGSNRLRPAPIAALTNWAITEWGLYEKERDQGFAVEFFCVQVPNREVLAWTQPLINSAGEGSCALACRETGGGLEVLVHVIPEPGLALGWGLGPSVLRYPGRTAESSAPFERQDASPLISTVESDEGGRFYKDASRYELIMLRNPPEDPGPNAFWINLAEMKVCLQTSNLCTIQLRGLTSHLLAI